ncbi:MAG: threonine/serine exporter family protein [Actinobacteria bacterium]|nr:threonine/serine exporter family protein [Actinomycetota bacterium]
MEPLPSPEDEDRAELEAILQTSLEFGVRVQMSGGYTARVRDSMQRVATNLGADTAETWISSGSIGLVVHRGGWSRTSIRTTPAMGVNFTELSYLSRLAKRSAGMSIEAMRAELTAVAQRDRRYPVPLVLVMLGVSCGSFAAIFGADPWGIGLAMLAGTAGAATRHFLHKRHFKPFIYCLIAALVSASVVCASASATTTFDAAVTASILFLIPGVPMLNGTADLLTSNYLNGLVRLTRAAVILLGAALGLALALAFWEQL